VIRPATASDADSIARIYNHYILNTIITFEEQTVSASEIAGRIAEVASASLPWLVAEHGGRIVGYAYASKWKGRCAYRFPSRVPFTSMRIPLATATAPGSMNTCSPR
jgi:phosphinothricin acetyltransferase